jgi:hypothetical protein
MRALIVTNIYFYCVGFAPTHKVIYCFMINQTAARRFPLLLRQFVPIHVEKRVDDFYWGC